MKRLISILAIILIVQVGLVIYSYSGRKENVTVGVPLLTLDASAVDSITLVGGDKKKVVMKKIKGEWVLPDRFDVAADRGRIEGFLTKIAAIKTGWPVASSAAAASRFHVASDQYKVKIVLHKADGTIQLYLGDSAGVRSAYLRMEGSDNIYRSSLAAYDFPADPDKWLDSSMLKRDEKDIVELQLNDLVLIRKNEEFRLKDAKPGETDSTVAKNIVTTLVNIVPDGILGAGEESSYDLEQPVIRAVIKKKDGSTLKYRFGRKEKEENKYALKMSDDSHYFKISRWRINTLLDADRETLLSKEEKKK